MKNYLKITAVLIIVILLAALGRSYFLFDNINDKLQKDALKNFNILSDMTEHYMIKHSSNQLFSEGFSYINKSKYKTNLISVNKEKIDNIDENYRKGISYLNNNKNTKHYFKEINEGHFIYIKKFTKLSDKNKDIYFSMLVDCSKELIKQKNKNIYIFITIITIGIIICVITYKLFRNYSAKEKQFLINLQSEVKEKTNELHIKNKELTYKFYNDTLTRLPNRSKLIEDLDQNTDVKKCLMLVNIDNFKEMNDFYGFEIGDEILVSFGNFLSSHAKKYSLNTYKLHADEYALLSLNTDKEFLNNYIKDLFLQMKNLSIMTEDDYTLEIQATLGVSINTYDLISSANMALKKAKRDHLPYLFYDESLKIKNEYKNNLKWTKKIKKAIKNDKILAYCQPILSCDTNEAKKFEVLARLQDSNGEIVSPYFFLDIAKKNKFYPHITKTIVKQAFDTFKDTDYAFSINISILDILNPQIVSFIIDMIKKYPNPKNIHFEILESEGIKNFDEILEFIKVLKQYGCKISIDDFGSGYSNFEHILNLKVDTLKIDASLIKNIDKDPNAHTIVSTIISFANKLNIATCAEFVHSKEVYEELLKIKTTYLQGYYISEPFPIQEAKNFKLKLDK